MKIKSRKLVVATVLSIFLLSGCSTNSLSSSGMMGSASKYLDSSLTCTKRVYLEGSVIKVSLGDMGMNRMMGGTAPIGSHMRLLATPNSVPAGKVSILVFNYGWRTHEVVVLPLTAGQAAGSRTPNSDGKVDESGSLGEASNSCGEGSGEGITAGSESWVTLDLKPGRYEFVCNLPNHYADGMYQEVDVI